MTNDRNAVLEDQIRSTLRERADAFHPVPPGIPVEAFTPKRAPQRSGRRIGAIAAGVTVAAMLGAGIWFAARPTTSSDVSTRDQELPPGPAGAGAEVPLQEVPVPPGVKAWLTEGGNADRFQEELRFGPEMTLVALRPGDGPPLVIATETLGASLHQCVGIPILRDSKTVSWWTQQCRNSPPPPPEAPPAPDRIRNLHADGDDSVMYLAWLDVPPGTAYSTLESGALRSWQRPQRGINVFPVSAAGSIEATVRAFASDGRLLAEVPVAIPDDGPFISKALPPWYNLDAKRRWCDTAAIAEVNLGNPAEIVRAYDRGTGGVAELDAREACKQAATLTPFPLGDLTAHYGVVDGRVHADYFEKAVTVVDGIETHTTGAPVPEAIAHEQIDADRARVTAECTDGGTRAARQSQCSIPG